MSLKQNGKNIMGSLNKSSNNDVKNRTTSSFNKTKYFGQTADTFNKFANQTKNDDQVFVETDVKKLVSITDQNRTKIWEKSQKDEEKDNINIRKKIADISKGSKETESGIAETVGEGKIFFNKNHLDVIKEANQIMKERSKNSGLTLSTKTTSVNDFILQNKEICLKNFLIDLLKTERTAIAGKQEKITRALNDSEKKLESDQNEFRLYMESEKNILQTNEKKFFSKLQKNKELTERKKKLTQDNKQIQDEIVRQISIIFNYKLYALFIHNVMNDNNYKFSKESHLYDPKNSELIDQNKDFEKVLEKILDDFKYLRVSSNTIKGTEILKESNKLTQKFQELEDNILKSLDKKQNTEKELEQFNKNNKNDIEELSKKNLELEVERIKLENERDKDLKYINHLDKQKKNGTLNREYLDYVRDLHDIAMGLRKGEEEIKDFDAEKKKLYIKKKNDNNYIKELLDYLKIMESSIIKSISDLVKCELESPSLISDLIIKRKNENKEIKTNALKRKQDVEAHDKMLKAKERMNRVVVKGKTVMAHNQIHKEKKNEINLTNTDKENDEKYIMLYENSEFNG